MSDRDLLEELKKEIRREPYAVEFDNLDNLIGLFLNGCNLTTLPEIVGKMEHLTVLCLGVITSNDQGELGHHNKRLGRYDGTTLRSNFLKTIPHFLGELKNLRFLDISYNFITEIPQHLAQLQNLQSLDLSSNQLTEIPQHLAQLQNLQSLDLSYNQLTEIPQHLAQLQNLQSLDLNSNQLTEIPQHLAQLQNLQSLYLSSNQLTEIPQHLAQLQNLQSLDLRYNQLTEIPQHLAQLQNLQSLDLSYNELTEIPQYLAQLQNLQSLDLRNTRLTEIPQHLAQLQNLQSLDLSDNQLTEIPQHLAQLQNLQSLDLRYNQLTEIPQHLAQLQNLQSLDLRYNQLTEIPQHLAQLQNLQSLYLSYNQLTEIPQHLAQLQNLQSLYLSYNQLTEIPQHLAQLQNLQSLDLNSNQLTEIPQHLAQLQNLQSLYLSSNQLTEIPQHLAQLQNLQSLYLSYNQLTEIPQHLAQLQNLQSLDLSYNELTEIPQYLAQLQNLQSLDLRNTRLTEIPQHLAQLQNLQSLDLRYNQLTEIPQHLAQLQNLQSLDLSDNQLTEIPQHLAQLQNLQSLDLSDNQLTEIPQHLAQLQNLQSLDLRYNQLTEIPQHLAQLQNLQSLDLSYNQLTEIPQHLAQLQNLQSLYLNSNQLTEIPQHLAQLQNLQSLYLRYNLLTEIPQHLAQLQNLQSLDLRYNLLTEIPQHLAQLQNLQSLYLNDNPISEQLIESFGRSGFSGRNSLLTFFETLFRREAATPINELKLLLIGQGEVGKTSVVKRIIHDDFDPEECKTEGINIEQWPLPGSAQDGDDEVKLNVWDFGGQEIMHATHQFFLTRRAIYLLVVNARKEEDLRTHRYWLETVQSFGGDAPIIIVINKIDQHDFRLNEQALLEINPNIVEFVRFSCKTGQGREKLIEAINRVVNEKLEEARQPFPEKWINIKSYLEELKHAGADFIPFDDYLSRCAAEELNEQQAKQLIEFMHRLGVVISYHEDDRLMDTSIINPEWITTGVYTILNAQEMAESEGVLLRNNIGKLLDAKRYPSSRRRFIIEMMKKFELCYEFEEGDRFLIPDLFSKKEPAFGWDSSSALRFHYRYSFLPNSIISRFIVRQHSRIDRDLKWRNGVVLKDEENRAVIRSKQHENLLEIEIVGEKSRQFLEKIRFALHPLHESFKGMEVRAEVPIKDSKQAVDYKMLLEMEKAGAPTHWVPDIGPVDVLELLNGVSTPESRQFENDMSRMEWLELFGSHFNEQELRGVLFDLNIDFQDIPGESRIDRMRELVRLMERQGIHGNVLRHPEIQQRLKVWRKR